MAWKLMARKKAKTCKKPVRRMVDGGFGGPWMGGMDWNNWGRNPWNEDWGREWHPWHPGWHPWHNWGWDGGWGYQHWHPWYHGGWGFHHWRDPQEDEW